MAHPHKKPSYLHVDISLLAEPKELKYNLSKAGESGLR